MEYNKGCLLCGKDLVYNENGVPLKCALCGITTNTNAHCQDGHYICDNCHQLDACDYIEKFCIHSHNTNPLAMAITLMQHENVKMHGPEHHFLVPAVLLSAYYNVLNDGESKIKKIAVARKRAEAVPGGFCGFYGNCGAGVGTGIFISLITNATPLSKEEWKLSNLMTSKSLLAISQQGGPRCCKRDTYLAIKEAISFLKEYFKVDLENLENNEPVKCLFYRNNKECRAKDCHFFPV